MPCVMVSLRFGAACARCLGVLPSRMEVCFRGALCAGRARSVFYLRRWNVPPSVFLMWEGVLREEVLGDEDREGAMVHGFEERAVGKREHVDCAGYMGFVLPSSNLHSKFEVASFSCGSREWVQEVLAWVLEADGPF